MGIDLDLTFGPYRPQNQDTVPKYRKVQMMVKDLALLFDQLCPESREKSVAMTKLQEAKMWANAAIALHSPAGKSDD